MKIVTINKKLRNYFEVIEKYEAGIILTGSEIKAIRTSGIDISNSYVSFSYNALYLVNANIQTYGKASFDQHKPLRKRKLLMHKKEIQKIQLKLKTESSTMIVTKIYFNKKSLLKLEIALVKSLKKQDKRQKEKEKEYKKLKKLF